MGFVSGIKQQVLSMVAGITMVKNDVKCATYLLFLVEFGVLVVGISSDLNHVTKNTSYNSEQPRVRISEDRKRVCNRTPNYFQN